MWKADEQCPRCFEIGNYFQTYRPSLKAVPPSRWLFGLFRRLGSPAKQAEWERVCARCSYRWFTPAPDGTKDAR